MFTPEQLSVFAQAGWKPEDIKEMLAYDTEVQKAIEQGNEIKPEDVGNHIDEPKPEDKPADDSNNATTILENILGGNE